MFKIKEYIDTLKASSRYGKACKLLRNEKYTEAKIVVDRALELNAEGYMLTLHNALKAEIEFELGNFEQSKKTIIKLKEIFSSEADIWNSDAGKQVVDRVNWYWDNLEDK